MKISRFIFFGSLILEILRGPQVLGESFELTLKNPPTQIQVGDTLQIQIRGALSGFHVTYEPKIEAPSSFHPPVQSKAKLNEKIASKSLHEIGFGEPEVVETDGESLMNLVVLKEGALELPSLTLRGRDEVILGETLPLTLQVKSAISPEDPKPTEKEKLESAIGLSFPMIWVLVFLFLCALVIAGLVWTWRKRRKKSGRKEEPQVLLSEDQEALNALKELEKQGYLESGQFKLYYFRLSEILKAYVGRRYSFNALESTTDEMMRSLRRVDLHSAGEVSPLVERLDLVKFTDTVPTSGESAKLFQAIELWIEKTRRPLVVQEKSQVNAL